MTLSFAKGRTATGVPHNLWLQTFTGLKFTPAAPEPGQVCIVDIAHALANICRYAGHSTRFYSVAEHSVLVSRYVPSEFAMWGLLHDAAEAYISDLPSPVKCLLPEFQELELAIERTIAARFNLSFPMPPEVKIVDTAILADESAQIMSAPPEAWLLPQAALGVVIEGWSPEEARRRFLERYLFLLTGKEINRG